VTSITNYTGYTGVSSGKDISIWKISPAFVFTTNIKAATLPAQGTTSPAGTSMTVSGWGTTSVSYILSKKFKRKYFN
jgi:hypothetical protein